MKPYQIMKLIGTAGVYVCSWANRFVATYFANNTGWGGYSLRFWLDKSHVVVGSKVRFTLRASNAESFIVSKLYAQNHLTGSANPSFKTTPIQVTVGGSNSFTIPAGGSVVTDPVTFTTSASDGIILSAYMTSGGTCTITYSPYTCKGYYKSGDYAANASDIAWTLGSYVYLVLKVEICS